MHLRIVTRFGPNFASSLLATLYLHARKPPMMGQNKLRAISS